MEEYSVVTGKVCGNMINFLIKVLMAWGISLALSFIIMVIVFLGITWKDKRRYRITEKWGLKDFFESVRYAGKGNSIWFIFLIPIINVFISFMTLMLVFTDWGDNW